MTDTSLCDCNKTKVAIGHLPKKERPWCRTSNSKCVIFLDTDNVTDNLGNEKGEKWDYNGSMSCITNYVDVSINLRNIL